MEKPENLKIIVVGGTTYETRFTKKFERRVPYSPPDPRHVLGRSSSNPDRWFMHTIA
jgi:hypothetical protein